jgi:AraC-like DNA-binding protein
MHEHSWPIVLAASRDQRWRAQVRAKLDASSTIMFVDHINQVPRTLKSTPDIVIWHLDESVESSESYAEVFQYVRRIAPHSAVLAYGEPGRATAAHLLLAGRVGVDRLILRGFDDLAHSVREIWRTAPIERYVQDVLEWLELPAGRAASAVAYCLRLTTVGPLTVQQLADKLHVSRRTLGTWFNAAGFPAPERLIGWCRVCSVARLLADPHLSIGQIARALAFSSESDLRRTIARYMGCTPTQLRVVGGVPAVIVALLSHRSTGIIPIRDG